MYLLDKCDELSIVLRRDDHESLFQSSILITLA